MIRAILSYFFPPRPPETDAQRRESEEAKWTRIVFPASWERIKQNSRHGL